MITEEDIDKLRSLSTGKIKDNFGEYSPRKYSFDDKKIKELLINHKQNINAVELYIKRTDTNTNSEIRIYPSLTFRNKHCYERFRYYIIEFNDSCERFSKDVYSYIMEICDKITSGMKLIYAGESDNDWKMYFKDSIHVKCDVHYNAINHKIFFYFNGDTVCTIDLSKQIISDYIFAILKSRRHYEYLSLIYDYVNNITFHDLNKVIIQKEYESLSDDEKNIINSKEDINTISNISNDEYMLFKNKIANNIAFGIDLSANMFLHGFSKIEYVEIVKGRTYANVIIHASNHKNIYFQLMLSNNTLLRVFSNILASAYSYLNIIYNDEHYVIYKGCIDEFLTMPTRCRCYKRYVDDELVRLVLSIYCTDTDKYDKSWNHFCNSESEHDAYIKLLSKYINDDARFSESLNKRLEAASDSDKLLAMVNMY